MATHDVPAPPTPVIGRAAETGRITDALADARARLVTLTGPPGVGKTRLALAAAQVVADRYADGVVFVDLSRVARESVLTEVARAVGAGEAGDRSSQDRLIDYLRSRELLVVLDNCEHILPLPELADIIAACLSLRILATSRERLHLSAEREIAIAPLPVPAAADRGDAERIAANPAVTLLVSRAQAVRAEIAVTPDNADALADVCVRLDGLPLALELAAAQLKVFTPGELASRLAHRSILLAGGLDDMPARHEGLRTAISWSYNLMPDVDRVVFRRLAVFAGGWTLPAAEAVCRFDGEEFDVAVVTASLVDRSLITRTERRDGVTTFGMLESIREFAAEQLDEHGEAASARARHAEYFVELALRAELGMGTAREHAWYSWLWEEHANLRAALEYSVAVGAPAALPLAAALGWYWYTHGYIGEGRRVVRAALDGIAAPVAPRQGRAVELGQAAEGAAPVDPRQGRAVVSGQASERAEPVDPNAIAGARLIAGVLAWAHGDLDEAAADLIQSRQLSERTGDRRRRAVASAFLGHVDRDAGRFEQAAAHHRRAMRLFDEEADARGSAWAQFDLGLVAWSRDDLGEAAELLETSLSRFRGLDYSWAIAWAAWALAAVRSTADVTAAAPLVADALARFDGLDDRRGVAQCLEVVAQIALARSQFETAGRLVGAAAAIREPLAVPGMAREVEARERAERTVTQSLGPTRAARALSAGRALPFSAAVALARRGAGGDAAGPDPAPWPSPRECQVAALVAAGRTNREIGRVLGIAEKTVEVHIRNIMGKLGVRSRAEIAAWAVWQGVYDPESPA